MKWYYYLHTNGEISGKNPVVVDSNPQYFDSPFVEKTWLIDTEHRGDGWKMVIEALALGNERTIERAKELAVKWKMTYEDSLEFLKRHITPSSQQQKGMTIFIKEIFKMEPSDFWEKVEAQTEVQ